MNNIILATMVVIFTIYSQVVLRMRLSSKPLTASLFNIDYWLDLITDFWILSCAASFALSFACWSLVVASSANVAKIYPVTTSLTLVLITILNIILFNDRFNMTNLLGGGLIVLGIFLLLNQSAPEHIVLPLSMS